MFSSNRNQLKGKSDVHYFKLPYNGNLSHHIKNKLSKLCKEFCKENFNIKLVFNSFKIKNYFVYKDPIPNGLKSFLVYKFTCANCSSSYTATCFDAYNSVCFKTIDKANSKFDLKIKEALHIDWRKLECTTKSFSSRTFTITFVPACSFLPLRVFILLFFALLFHLLFSLSYANYRHFLLS